MKARSWLACVAVAAAIPLAASAEEAFTAGAVEVFSGPSSEYPPIVELPPNVPVNIVGCLSDWSWCDVIVGYDRGWVYAADLVVPYQGARLVVIEYGPRYHFCPVVTFSLVTYWDRYYRSRPFYAQRTEWVSRVHIATNHGGRAPAGHEFTARQSAPSAQSQQAQRTPVQTAKPAEKNARPTEAERARTAERTQSAQTEKARTAATEKAGMAATDKARTAEKSRTAEAGGATRAAPQPKETQRPQVAQSPRTEQPQPRQERKAPETQPSHTAQLAEHQHQAQQPPKAAPRPQQESRPPEANRREAGNAPHEEKKQEGKAE